MVRLLELAKLLETYVLHELGKTTLSTFSPIGECTTWIFYQLLRVEKNVLNVEP